MVSASRPPTSASVQGTAKRISLVWRRNSGYCLGWLVRRYSERLNKTREQNPSVFEPKMEEEEEEKSKPQLPSAVIKPTNKPQASANGSATKPIEVDDTEPLSIESIDITAFRTNRMHRMRL